MGYLNHLLRATVAGSILFGAAPALASDGVGAAMVEGVAASLAPNQFVWTDTGSSDPVRIVINIGEQRAYVYRGEQLVAASSVSTGKGGKETPSGSFTILEKQVDHKSTLYNSAPMPFMERLTWDGVAIHAGRNPGYAASHGCVRVPLAFAKKLYGITTVGTQVTVIGADGLVAPTPYVPGDSADETAAANKAGAQLASR